MVFFLAVIEIFQETGSRIEDFHHEISIKYLVISV